MDDVIYVVRFYCENIGLDDYILGNYKTLEEAESAMNALDEYYKQHVGTDIRNKRPLIMIIDPVRLDKEENDHRFKAWCEEIDNI